MTDPFFDKQHKDASDTRLLIVLGMISAFGIFAGIYSMTTHEWDHEQMSVTQTLVWENGK